MTNSLFYPDFSRFFIRIQPWHRKFSVGIWIQIKKHYEIRIKKRICHVNGEITRKLVFLDPDKKAKLTWWWRHLSQAFPDKKVTPPVYIFCQLIMNALSASRFHNESTHHWQVHQESAIFFLNSLRIHDLSHKMNINRLFDFSSGACGFIWYANFTLAKIKCLFFRFEQLFGWT